MGFRFVSHTADVKFIAEGKTIEEAFFFVANALFATMYGDESISRVKKRSITVSGKDVSSLLYAFVEEIIFLLDSEGFVGCLVENITIHDSTLTADLYGDDAHNYNLSTEVKAMTYNDMEIVTTNSGVTITGVFDV